MRFPLPRTYCVGPPTMSTPTAPQADTPGDSAQREYERRKAASVKTSLDKTLADLARASSSERQAIRAWADGAEGERKLGAVLKALPGLRVVSDCSVGGANLDFIVIGRSGVFVVDAKHYTGVITFRDDGDSSAPHLRLYVDGWDRSYLADEMWWQVKRVRRALATKLKPVPFVTPVLCFVDGTWSIPLP